jgi:hypothetical protein
MKVMKYKICKTVFQTKHGLEQSTAPAWLVAYPRGGSEVQISNIDLWRTVLRWKSQRSKIHRLAYRFSKEFFILMANLWISSQSS